MSEEQKESSWAKIGEVRESKDKPGSFYVKVDHYKGLLLFVGMDKNSNLTGDLHRVDTISLRKPFENEATWIREVLSINKANPTGTKALELEELVHQLMKLCDPERMRQLIDSEAQTDQATK